MTLELYKVASQVKAMGHSLAEHSTLREQIISEARELLQAYSTDFAGLADRVDRAEKVQQQQRFEWVGAAPTAEALAQAYPLPPSSERLTIMASDGSQILPDRHAITLYYLINVGSIIYRHGSDRKPQTYHPEPILCYRPEDLFDDQGRLISGSMVAVERDLAELRVLTELAPAARDGTEPVVALIDGQLTLRVIDLPFFQQEAYLNQYLDSLAALQAARVLAAGYIDRPRSTFVLSLLHLASLAPEAISEETLRQSRFRFLTDLELFDFLGSGQRSAIFAVRAKGGEKYQQAGHGIYFFYVNVGGAAAKPNLARIEVPAWLANDTQAVDTLHAAIVRQAALTGGYPYVLARADELAVISNEEREAVELMLAVEMRRQGLRPAISSKQSNKNAFRSRKESFQL